MPRGSRQSDLSDYMSRYGELMDQLQEERLEAVKQYTDIHNAIRSMKNEEEKEMLERKYLMRQTWEEIAQSLGYSRITVIRKHGEALINFEIP